MFIYNKLYIKDLIGASYKVKSFKDEPSKQEVAPDVTVSKQMLQLTSD